MFWKKKSNPVNHVVKKKSDAYRKSTQELHAKTQQLDLRKMKLQEILNTKSHQGSH